MNKIGYTGSERDLMNALSIRSLLVLKRIARLIGRDGAEAPLHRIPLARFIGKEADAHDIRSALITVTKMSAIVEEAWVRYFSLFVRFRPEAMSLVSKMASQAADCMPCGNGVAYCDAALALKRAMGVRSEVWLTRDFEHMEFNHGEDTSHLDKAFDSDSWEMSFEESAGEFLQIRIAIQPTPNGQVDVTQSVFCKWPGCDFNSAQHLGLVPVGDFINQEKWENLLPGMGSQGRKQVEKAKEEVQAILEVRLDNGAVLSRPEILRRMEAVCREKDALCRLFGAEPEVRPSPEWPLGQEPKAYYREYSCGLAAFIYHYVERFGCSMRWDAEEFARRLWLVILEEKFGKEPDAMDFDDYGSASNAKDFRERVPDKAAEIEFEYRQEIGKATIRIAWGLATEDFRRARAFVSGVISHPAVGKKELKHIGWPSEAKNMELPELRKCLEDAIRDALSQP